MGQGSVPRPTKKTANESHSHGARSQSAPPAVRNKTSRPAGIPAGRLLYMGDVEKRDYRMISYLISSLRLAGISAAFFGRFSVRTPFS